jgi:hypothetical protein
MIFETICKKGNIEEAKKIYNETYKHHINYNKALILACESNNFDIAEWLLEINKNLHVRVKNDYLFDSALKHKNLDLIKFLHKHDRYILQVSLHEYLNMVQRNYKIALWLYKNNYFNLDDIDIAYKKFYHAYCNKNIKLIEFLLHVNIKILELCELKEIEELFNFSINLKIKERIYFFLCENYELSELRYMLNYIPNINIDYKEAYNICILNKNLAFAYWIQDNKIYTV